MLESDENHVLRRPFEDPDEPNMLFRNKRSEQGAGHCAGAVVYGHGARHVTNRCPSINLTGFGPELLRGERCVFFDCMIFGCKTDGLPQSGLLRAVNEAITAREARRCAHFNWFTLALPHVVRLDCMDGGTMMGELRDAWVLTDIEVEQGG